jgi:hypothetical protein
MALAERAFFLMQRLSLRWNNDLYPLSVNLFKLIGIGISGIGTGCITGLFKQIVRLLNLPGKLVDITGIIHRLGMHNQPMAIIYHALNIIAGVAALNTIHDGTARIGLIDHLPFIRLKGIKYPLDAAL